MHETRIACASLIVIYSIVQLITPIEVVVGGGGGLKRFIVVYINYCGNKIFLTGTGRARQNKYRLP